MTEMTKTILQALAGIPVVPVVKINHAETAAELARALHRGGIPAAEITFRTDRLPGKFRRYLSVPVQCWMWKPRKRQ